MAPPTVRIASARDVADAPPPAAPEREPVRQRGLTPTQRGYTDERLLARPRTRPPLAEAPPRRRARVRAGAGRAGRRRAAAALRLPQPEGRPPRRRGTAPPRRGRLPPRPGRRRRPAATGRGRQAGPRHPVAPPGPHPRPGQRPV